MPGRVGEGKVLHKASLYTGRLRLEVQLLNLLDTILTEKVPISYTVKIVTTFQKSNWAHCIPFLSPCKLMNNATVEFKHLRNRKKKISRFYPVLEYIY